MCDNYQPVTQSNLLRYSSLQFLYFLLFNVFFSFHFFTDLIEERMWAYSSHPSRITATQQKRLNSMCDSYQPVTQSDLLRYSSLQFLYFLLFNVFFSFHFFTDL